MPYSLHKVLDSTKNEMALCLMKVLSQSGYALDSETRTECECALIQYLVERNKAFAAGMMSGFSARSAQAEGRMHRMNQRHQEESNPSESLLDEARDIYETLNKKRDDVVKGLTPKEKDLAEKIAPGSTVVIGINDLTQAQYIAIDTLIESKGGSDKEWSRDKLQPERFFVHYIEDKACADPQWGCGEEDHKPKCAFMIDLGQRNVAWVGEECAKTTVPWQDIEKIVFPAQ